MTAATCCQQACASQQVLVPLNQLMSVLGPCRGCIRSSHVRLASTMTADYVMMVDFYRYRYLCRRIADSLVCCIDVVGGDFGMDFGRLHAMKSCAVDLKARLPSGYTGSSWVVDGVRVLCMCCWHARANNN